MAHSRIKNGGLLHARGLVTKQSAFGRGGNGTSAASTDIQEAMLETERIGKKGDARCPYCHQMNHDAWEQTHECSNFGCQKRFKIKDMAKAASY